MSHTESTLFLLAAWRKEWQKSVLPGVLLLAAGKRKGSIELIVFLCSLLPGKRVSCIKLICAFFCWGQGEMSGRGEGEGSFWQ